MSEILAVLKYTIPAIIVFITAYTLLKEFFAQEVKKRHIQMVEEKHKVSLPLRMQAYERIILLLERIAPKNLIMRVHGSKMTATQFHATLIKAIRDEFDHNLSQQLYISTKAWEMVKNSKEEIVRQINTCAGQLDEKATSMDLSKKIMEVSTEKSAIKKTIEFIKAEARKSFL